MATLDSIPFNFKETPKRDRKSEAYVENRKLGRKNASVTETPESSAPLRYPYTKIDEHDDYLRLEVVKFTPPGLQKAEDSLRLRTSDEIAKKDIKHTIMLPVPQGVLDGRSADWNMSELGPIAALTASAVGAGLRQEGSLASMAGASFTDVVNTVTAVSYTHLRAHETG